MNVSGIASNYSAAYNAEKAQNASCAIMSMVCKL